MKAIITKLIATLTLTIAALFTVPALAESGAFASNTGFGLLKTLCGVRTKSSGRRLSHCGIYG